VRSSRWARSQTRLASDLASGKGVSVLRGMGDGSVQRRDSDWSTARITGVNAFSVTNGFPLGGIEGKGTDGSGNFAAGLNQFGCRRD
jgi:hypothetical protein